MALMPGDGRYPVATFADLQYVVARAPYDLQAAQTVRDFLMQAYCYRLLMTGDAMDKEQRQTALAQLQEAQRRAAERGSYFTLEWEGVTYHPPSVTTNNLNLPAVPPPKPAPPPKPSAPRAPAGVHFASHQRVGDETRDSYIEHVHDMFARGFIDAGEHDARLKALMRTRTKEEMEFLIQDLPEVPDRTGGQVEVTQKRSLLLYPALAAVSGTGAFGLLAWSPANLGIIAACVVLFTISAVLAVLGLTSFLKRGK